MGRPSFAPTSHTGSSLPPGLHRSMQGFRRLVEHLSRSSSTGPLSTLEVGAGEGLDGRMVRVLADYVGGNARTVFFVDVQNGPELNSSDATVALALCEALGKIRNREDHNPLDPRLGTLIAEGEKLRKEGEEVSVKLVAANSAYASANEALMLARNELEKAQSDARRSSEEAKRKAALGEWQAKDDALKAQAAALALQREAITIRIRNIHSKEETRREKIRTIDAEWRLTLACWEAREWALNASYAESRYNVVQEAWVGLRNIYHGTVSKLGASNHELVEEHELRLADAEKHSMYAFKLSNQISELEAQSQQLTNRLNVAAEEQSRLKDKTRELEMERALHAREQAAAGRERDAATGERDAIGRERDALARERDLAVQQKNLVDKELASAQKEVEKVEKRLQEAQRTLEDEKACLEDRIAALTKQKLKEAEDVKKDAAKLRGENELKDKHVETAVQLAKEEVEKAMERRKKDRLAAKKEQERLEARVRELEVRYLVIIRYVATILIT
ncbi:hypothetical protein M427DRAFT_265252 [Gonapodya prolifera JEL478]|uniref:Uncharacterized protein n=1 Tax=Gonapodya prolifera (strain JEL478) TaxID=1344416 RepID=A0A139ALC1_GONPJ|nr:hypothetical protein M427DRAFT_265252 [Gonapodya prolifera JEL478]|eukprot:KXS17215.1 hypothetical protein M427DRAFT_265252 [Gonapodya prolifera JEL478]